MYDIDEANKTPDKRPRWFKSYDFKEEYQVSNLSLASLDSLLIRWCQGESDDLRNYNKYV